MSFYTWLAGALGRAIDLDHAYGAQCVDLVNDWLVHGLHVAPVSGNAVDIIRGHPGGFHWVANEPTNAPAQGSIVVWRANVPAVGIGRYGHTAVALGGDAAHLVTIDQNWSGQQVATINVHSYTGVAGWWQPVQLSA